MEAQLAKIWLNEFDGRKDIRTDFTNDRHHAVVIEYPHGSEQVAKALFLLASMIAKDTKLRKQIDEAKEP